jgi:hypothetical protein
MSAPAKRLSARTSALPEPELVSLPDDPLSGQEAIPAPWWAEYGGKLDQESGVVAFPPNALPPCPFPCERCARRKGAGT